MHTDARLCLPACAVVVVVAVPLTNGLIRTGALHMCSSWALLKLPLLSLPLIVYVCVCVCMRAVADWWQIKGKIWTLDPPRVRDAVALLCFGLYFAGKVLLSFRGLNINVVSDLALFCNKTMSPSTACVESLSGLKARKMTRMPRCDSYRSPDNNSNSQTLVLRISEAERMFPPCFSNLWISKNIKVSNWMMASASSERSWTLLTVLEVRSFHVICKHAMCVVVLGLTGREGERIHSSEVLETLANLQKGWRMEPNITRWCSED